MIAVPTDRYLGNEDGQGGFGALQYDAVMSQIEPYNTDSNHPILIVLHHDGDNYGGGSPSYYQNNFQAFVTWLQANPNRFVCSTVEDYLQLFPPDTNDVIHVESGSWSGADNGDPEFKKWNADYNNCYSYDRNSWNVVTATKNIIETAAQASPGSAQVDSAYKYFDVAQSSDYWYWDGSTNGIWDANPTRACNLAIPHVLSIAQGATDLTPPSIWLPQREPYNPGSNEWNVLQSSDFTVWTYAYDLNTIQNIELKWRTDNDGQNPLTSVENETYAGGSGVSAWNTSPMTQAFIPSQTNPMPQAHALQYSGQILGQGNKLIDYYVEATDANGNVAKSPIQHVWVGPANSISYSWANCDTSATGGGGGVPPGVSWSPQFPTTNDTITVYVGNTSNGGKLHWGVNNWLQVNNGYWPGGTVLFNGSGPAVQSPMVGPGSNNYLSIKIGPFNKPAQVVNKVDFVINFNNNTWDNNNGNDYHILVSPASAISEINSNSISITPNPANNIIRINTNSKNNFITQLTITDILGKTIMSIDQKNQANNFEVDISSMHSGMYMIIAKTSSGMVKEKLVKE